MKKSLRRFLKTYPDKEINRKRKEVACNPFEKYRQENGPIQYSKKGKGPEIKSLNTMIKIFQNHLLI